MSQGTKMRVAVVGYGAEGRDLAMRLRGAGHDVSVGMLPAGSSWVRAKKDGFVPASVAVAVRQAAIVAVLVPDADQTSVYWRAIAPNLAPGALVVFARGFALHAGTIDPRNVDVVLVAQAARGHDVAIHHDATGRALERAIAYAHAAFGEAEPIGTTTVHEEFEAELASAVHRAGSIGALLAELDTALARAQSHEPDEARLKYLEGLRAEVAKHARGAA